MLNIQVRLQGFNLKAYQQNGSVSFIYTDPSTSQDIYRIQSDTPHIPVSSVAIFATYNDVRGIILTLCEVEMFGDVVCPTGQYGRECNNSCNCAKSGVNCFVSTGACPSGCDARYQGERCQMQRQVDPSPIVAEIVGPVVAFVVLITLIVIGVLIWRKRRHRKDYPAETSPPNTNNYAEDDSVGIVVSSPATSKPDTAVAAQAKPIDDDSRVQLQTDILKKDGAHINASLNDDFQQKKQFIATQDRVNEMPMDSSATTHPAGHANYDYPEPSADDTTANSYMQIADCAVNAYENSNDIMLNPYDSVNNDIVTNVYDDINDNKDM